ncbi:hypothetical protein BC829DRAFT_429709 [Chytridium lagenaria]|nr:hypothetical protein BC829DRAFT_429709 [Chytridium lagenaria]
MRLLSIIALIAAASTVSATVKWEKEWSSPPSLTPLVPSATLPNHLTLLSGETFGVTNDNVVTVMHKRTIVEKLEQRSMEWRAYYDSFPGSCSPVSTDPSGTYLRRTNPFISLSTITSRVWAPLRCIKVVNSNQLFVNEENGFVARYNYYVPGLTKSGVLGLEGVEAWLKEFLERRVGKMGYERTTFVVTFDKAKTESSPLYTILLVQYTLGIPIDSDYKVMPLKCVPAVKSTTTVAATTTRDYGDCYTVVETTTAPTSIDVPETTTTTPETTTAPTTTTTADTTTTTTTIAEPTTTTTITEPTTSQETKTTNTSSSPSSTSTFAASTTVATISTSAPTSTVITSSKPIITSALYIPKTIKPNLVVSTASKTVVGGMGVMAVVLLMMV